MGTVSAPTAADLDGLLDSSLDMIEAASQAAAVMTDLVRRIMTTDPEAARAALSALNELGAAQGCLLAAVGQVDG